MKNPVWFLLGGFVFALVLALQFGRPAQTTMSQNLTETPQRLPAQEPNYCIALRGNGELEPAHWGALARTVELMGLPSAMAGGSSATISMFLMESIASNPLIAGQNPDLQKERASLLLKSLLGFFGELEKTKSWKDVKAIYGTYQKAESLNILTLIGKFIQQGQFGAVISTTRKAIDLGLLNSESAQPLMTAAVMANAKKAQFYWSQIMETASVFGKFDAAHDDNLFFRNSLISFEKATSTFGKIASFYSTQGDDANQVNHWREFFDSCSPNTKGQTWTEITKSRPNCTLQFHALFKKHFENENKLVPVEEREIGKSIRVYPTTTVLIGSAVKQVQDAIAQYNSQMDAHFGKNFHINNPEEVRFGYWGQPDKLKQISQLLDRTDEKSRRFLPLGTTTWKQVLSLSPAEPGLSPLKEFTSQGQKYVSAGGWSDLHPVLVLKASGCDHVVYLTRQGGESLFAQGVAKRLLNLDRAWSLLDPENSTAKKMNDEGDPSDRSSTWSKLYNLGNPTSSVNRSLAKASAVLCTNWNAFDVKKDMQALIEDSYHSSFWINQKLPSSLSGSLSPVLNERKAGCGIF